MPEKSFIGHFPGKRRVAKIPVNRMIANERTGLDTCMMPITGPQVIIRTICQTACHRLHFDKPAAPHYPFPLLDQGSPESPFPQRSASTILFVETGHIMASDPLHHTCHSRLVCRRHEQMDTAFQQRISVNIDPVLARRLFQPVHKQSVIFVIDEYLLAIVTLLVNMMRPIRNDQP